MHEPQALCLCHLMRARQIRPIAICLFRHGERLLVSEGFDAAKQSYFCRPLGGGIEFGETSHAAVLREIEEEIGAAIENLRLVGVLENIFMYEGQRGHEIVFVYDAEFVDKTLYEQAEIICCEVGVADRFQAVWRSLAEMEKNKTRLVPEGLVELLTA